MRKHSPSRQKQRLGVRDGRAEENSRFGVICVIGGRVIISIILSVTPTGARHAAASEGGREADMARICEA
jgi:hypothetical protein